MLQKHNCVIEKTEITQILFLEHIRDSTSSNVCFYFWRVNPLLSITGKTTTKINYSEGNLINITDPAKSFLPIFSSLKTILSM